ncbi:MAG: type II secretion system protein [Thermodesulfobacteriota bacterium]
MRRHQPGFSLIEVIAVLLLLGVLSAFAGMGIVSGVNAVQSAKETVDLAQRAQFALTRLSREMLELGALTSGPAPPIVYQNFSGTHTLTHDVNLKTLALDNDLLLDRVNAFVLVYRRADGSAWNSAADPLSQLFEVSIQLSLNRSDGQVVTFQTTVSPRNNGTVNGPTA